MPAFKDAKGRTWEVVVTVTTLKNCLSLLDVDLATVAENKFALIRRLLVEPVLTGDVLYVTCKAQAEKAGVSDVEFGEGLFGDALDQGCAALMEALANFSREPATRRALTEVAKRVRLIEQDGLKKVEQVISSGELDKAMKIESSQEPKSGEQSTDTPEKSA